MKKISLLLSLLLLLGLSSMVYGAQGDCPYGNCPYGDSRGWQYCPYCGQPLGQGGYGMGPGMMHGRRGMGPGMMGPQYGPQYGPGYQGPQYQQPQKPMDEKDAKELLENYLQSTRNPNLKLGKIEDKGNAFEAEIQTKEGTLVDKILVDKRTGWMRSVY